MKPLFSIITVTRNAAATLPVTLRSVEEQTCDLFELIVVDGHSSDGTAELARACRIADKKVLSEPDDGIYDAMNKGLALSCGEYVIFLNAGDAFYGPDTLQIIADTAMRHDFPGVIYGQTVIVDAQGREIGPRHLTAPDELTVSSFADGMVVCHQAFIVLRKITVPFDTRWRLSADYEWCIQCIQAARRCRIIPRPPLVRYLNEGMTTRCHRRSLMERFRIMCRHYGTLPTIFRHLGFALRALRRKLRHNA